MTMLNLIQQPERPPHLQAFSAAISVAEIRESQRLKFQIVALKMDSFLNNPDEKLERQMFNHFCERVLPVTFRDWMTKR
jgi:hypothetical protein